MSDDDTDPFLNFIRNFFGRSGISFHSSMTTGRMASPDMETIMLGKSIILVQDLSHLGDIVIQHKIVQDREKGPILWMFSEDGRYQKTIPLPETKNIEYDLNITNGVLEVVFKKKE